MFCFSSFFLSFFCYLLFWNDSIEVECNLQWMNSIYIFLFLSDFVLLFCPNPELWELPLSLLLHYRYFFISWEMLFASSFCLLVIGLWRNECQHNLFKLLFHNFVFLDIIAVSVTSINHMNYLDVRLRPPWI